MKITLCGSAKFEQLFHELNERLTLGGHVVYALSVYPSFKAGNKNWYTETQKLILDKIHMKKIDESDAIVVINPQNYIGMSTAKEIRHAVNTYKKIYYYEGGPNFMHLLPIERRGLEEIRPCV